MHRIVYYKFLDMTFKGFRSTYLKTNLLRKAFTVNSQWLGVYPSRHWKI